MRRYHTADAGNAHTYGKEFEIQALVTQELVASLNTGYTHAALVSANPLDSSFNPGKLLQDDPKMGRIGVARLSAPADGSIRAGIDLNYRFK